MRYTVEDETEGKRSLNSSIKVEPIIIEMTPLIKEVMKGNIPLQPIGFLAESTCTSLPTVCGNTEDDACALAQKVINGSQGTYFFRFCLKMQVKWPRPHKIPYNQLASRFRQRVFNSMVSHCVGSSIPLSYEIRLKIYASVIAAGQALVDPQVLPVSKQFLQRPKKFAKLSCWYEVFFFRLSGLIFWLAVLTASILRNLLQKQY